MKPLYSFVAVPALTVAFAGSSFAANVEEKRQELQEEQQEVREKQKELQQEIHKESAGRAQEANQAMQQVSRASKIIGTDVKNPTGDNLGNIKELVLDPDSGHVVYAVLSFGGVLGVGDKLFAVPWKALHWRRDKEYYLLDAGTNTLTNAPGFDKNHWPDSSNKWEQTREEVYQFYHVTP